MRRLALCFLAAALPALADPVERSRRDEVFDMRSSEPAMARAFARARATLDEFLRIAESPPAHLAYFSVKLGVREGENTEFFWIQPFDWEGEAFRGRISNHPRLVGNVSLGQVVEFRKAEIVDWTYHDQRTRRMHGNFTACALLTKETPEDAARFRAHYGLQCD